MTLPTRQIKALCFDYCNTLVEYGRRQIADQYSTLGDLLSELFGACDRDRLQEIRDKQALAPYSNGFRENDPREISEELITELYGVAPEEEHVERIMRTRYETFVKAITLDENVLRLLTRLSERYRLSLISNYPCSRSIRDSLEKIGLSGMFASVVISADVGYIKPDGRPFESLTSELGLSPSQCVLIGDNWLADVQGAKRAGMYAIHLKQHVPYERFESSQEDHDPDASIGHIEELGQILLDD